MYSKTDAVTFGQKLGELGVALLDGLGPEDIGAAIAAAQAGAAAVNEFQEIPGAAGLHIASGTTEVLGDHFEAQGASGE